MLTFEKINMREYHVAIFDYGCCEVVKKCFDHIDAFWRIVDDIEEE
jgi:hypothetical protein